MLMAVGALLTILASGAMANAAVAGRVSGVDDGSLPGVTVTAASVNGGASRRMAVTDEAGRYFFHELPAGSYRFTFELRGFANRETVVTASVGAERTVDMVLAWSPGPPMTICLCEPQILVYLKEGEQRAPPRLAEQRVRVVDPWWRPVPGVLVEVPSLGLRLMTESDGAVCFWYPEDANPQITVVAAPLRSVESDVCCLSGNRAVMLGEELR